MEASEVTIGMLISNGRMVARVINTYRDTDGSVAIIELRSPAADRWEKRALITTGEPTPHVGQMISRAIFGAACALAWAHESSWFIPTGLLADYHAVHSDGEPQG